MGRVHQGRRGASPPTGERGRLRVPQRPVNPRAGGQPYGPRLSNSGNGFTKGVVAADGKNQRCGRRSFASGGYHTMFHVKHRCLCVQI